ncbi:MAG: insulinase family protein [Puniceicoccales bacterium]|nr:insulinase family protein [Puniceicoccales bacterium]
MRKWLLWALLFFPLVSPVAAMDEIFFEVGGDIPTDSNAVCGVLDNGLHYYILPNKEPPGKVSMRLFVGVGSLMESDSQRGVAHFLEHMAFCGSENFSQNDLIDELHRMGMQSGYHTAATTGFTETVYRLELPMGTRQMLNDALLIFRDYLTGLKLAPRELDLERMVILNELRDINLPKHRDMQANYNFLFPGSIIGKRFPVGAENAIGEMTVDDVRNFYKKFYTPNASAVVVVGDVDPQMVIRCLKHTMGDIPPGRSSQPTDTGKIKASGICANVYRDAELPQVTVSINAVEPLKGMRDSKELRRKNIYDRVGNHVVTRRLERLSKQPNASFDAGESSTTYSMRNGVRMTSITLTTDGDRVLEAMRTAEKALRMAMETEFSPAEVEKAKAAILKHYADKLNQSKSKQSTKLANRWVRAIGNNHVPTSLEWDYEFAKGVMAAMTSADAWQAYRERWAPTNRLLYASGNLPRNIGELSLHAAYTKSQREFSRFDAHPIAETFAYKDFGKPGKIILNSYDKELNLYCYTFENGVRLNIKPTTCEAGKVFVHVRFGRGLLTEPRGKEGLAKFAAWSFVEGGLDRHSCDDLQDIFAGRTWDVCFDVGVDAFILSGRTIREDLDDELMLLAAYIVDPAFSEAGAHEAQKVITRVYSEAESVIEGASGHEGQQFFKNNSPFLGYPSQKVMTDYTMEDVRDWFVEELRDGYIEITIVGDVDVNRAFDGAHKTFGALNARTGKIAATIGAATM